MRENKKNILIRKNAICSKKQKSRKYLELGIWKVQTDGSDRSEDVV